MEKPTEKKELKKELERLRSLTDLILTSAGEGIFGLDREGKVFFINPTAEDYFGWPKGELLNKNMHDLTHHTKPNGKPYPRRNCPIYSAFSDKEVHQGSDEYFVRKNGELFPVEYTSRPLLENGKLVGAVVTFRDITRRIERERALQESEKRYRSMIAALHEGAVLQESDGTIVTFNHQAEELLGLSPEQLQGKKPIDANWYALNADGTRYDGTENPTLRTLQTGKPLENFIIGVHKPDNTVSWISINSQPITNRGDSKPSAVVSSFHDITAEKTAKEALETLNQQLAKSNKELEDFASVASHDLQEPLRKIQAFGDRMQSKFGSQLSDEGLDYLSRMQNASRRMQTLINDLLTFSRVTTQAKPFTKINLIDIIKEVLIDLEIAIERSEGKVVLKELPKIEADPLQMRQLFQNLIGNALKFKKNNVKPLITIYAEELASDHNCIRLFVKDNGIGFDEKYLDRIFNVFQKLHGSNEYAGSGVGLAVCRKIVERHNGSITATSQIGKGTTFIITLPKRQQEKKLEALLANKHQKVRTPFDVQKNELKSHSSSPETKKLYHSKTTKEVSLHG